MSYMEPQNSPQSKSVSGTTQNTDEDENDVDDVMVAIVTFQLTRKLIENLFALQINSKLHFQ